MAEDPEYGEWVKSEDYEKMRSAYETALKHVEDRGNAIIEVERLKAVLRKAKPIVGAACAAAGATGNNDMRRAREKVYEEISQALMGTADEP